MRGLELVPWGVVTAVASYAGYLTAGWWGAGVMGLLCAGPVAAVIVARRHEQDDARND